MVAVCGQPTAGRGCVLGNKLEVLHAAASVSALHPAGMQNCSCIMVAAPNFVMP